MISGIVKIDNTELHWEFLVEDIAIITNGDGVFLVSCPEDVIEIDLNLKVRQHSWKTDRNIIIKDNVLEVYRKRDKEVFPIIRITRLLSLENNNGC